MDRELPRTPEESNLITFYKDAIRERCINDLVESWYLLLKEHSNKNAEITCQTLEVIGIYIDWIDINLIVNARFVEFFLYALGQVDLRETACSCIEEIIDKRMDIRAKLRLIDYLWDDVILKCAVALEQQINLSNVCPTFSAQKKAQFFRSSFPLLKSRNFILFNIKGRSRQLRLFA